MHDPTQHAATLTPHRDHVAAVAQRDGCVVHPMIRLELRHEAFEEPHELARSAPQLLPDAAQRRGRIIAQFPLLAQHALQSLLDGRAGDERVGEPGKGCAGRSGPGLVAQSGLREAGRLQEHDRQTQFAPGPRRSGHAQAPQRVAEFRHRVRSPSLVSLHEGAHRHEARLFRPQRRQRLLALGLGAADSQRAQGANALCARCA